MTNVQTFDLVRVYNVVGQEVNASIIKTMDKTQVYINTAGAYFIQVNARGKITTNKVIVNPK